MSLVRAELKKKNVALSAPPNIQLRAQFFLPSQLVTSTSCSFTLRMKVSVILHTNCSQKGQDVSFRGVFLTLEAFDCHMRYFVICYLILM